MKVVAQLEYTKVRQVGAGQGMNSEVYLVSDPQLGGQVVVKEIPRSSFVNSVTDFFAEAQAMFAAAHDRVVPVSYACATPTHVCVAMPFYPAGSLKDRIAAGPLSLREFIRVGQDVLTGVAQIHIAGYIHFDIKPSNVLFDERGRALVADFGQARKRGPAGTAKTPPLYSDCVPPEAYRYPTVTQAADLYQVGLLLYRAVNGDPHWKNQVQVDHALMRAAVLAEKFPNRSAFLPHVPERLRRIIRRALHSDPNARFPSASDFADELARVDVPIEWLVTLGPGGSISWRAARPGQPDLLVNLEEDAGAWAVRIFTDGPKGRRARDAPRWLTKVSQRDALRHLTKIFKDLG